MQVVIAHVSAQGRIDLIRCEAGLIDYHPGHYCVTFFHPFVRVTFRGPTPDVLTVYILSVSSSFSG